MVEAYLMHAKGIVGRIINASGIIGRLGDNYQLYAPEKGVLLGYFYNKDLKLSPDKFCEFNMDKNKKKKLDDKVFLKKYIKKMDVSDILLTRVINSFEDFDKAKKERDYALREFSDVENFMDYKFKNK